MSVECPECGNLVDYSYDYCPEYNIVAYVYECEFCGCVFEEWLDERNEDISYGIVIRLPLKEKKVVKSNGERKGEEKGK
jgi:uncharacterized Zn finger protein